MHTQAWQLCCLSRWRSRLPERFAAMLYGLLHTLHYDVGLLRGRCQLPHIHSDTHTVAKHHVVLWPVRP